MAVSHLTRPDGNKNSWTWENAERMVAFHHDVAGGEASEMVAIVRTNAFAQDIHIAKLVVSLETAAGDGKTVTITCGNGTSTMTVAITGSAGLYGSTTTNNFALDVSAEDLTIALSADGGSGAGCATIFLFYHDITIT